MMVGESGQLLHAPFTFGTDAFHLSKAEAASLLSHVRARAGSCVVAETVPMATDLAYTFWFTVP